MIYCASSSHDLDISLYCCRDYCASGLVKDFIWHNLTSQSRADELLAIKEKIRSSPEEVELWFDREIQKLRNIDLTGLLRIADKSD